MKNIILSGKSTLHTYMFVFHIWKYKNHIKIILELYICTLYAKVRHSFEVVKLHLS